MNYQYKSGFVFGKFLPPHLGHKYLIDTALRNSERVTLLVCSLQKEPIPGELRFEWLKDIYKDNDRIIIKHCAEELPQYPKEHKDFWNIWVDVFHRYCPEGAECLFTSELYGDNYARKIGIKHQMVDLERKTYPVSGTSVRTETWKSWNYIPDVVKPYFIKRIAIMGPESTGKSTLTKTLATLFSTNFVEEYGRTYYENQSGIKDVTDFIKISDGRRSLEKWLMKHSNKYLFCDTEDITTYIFSKMFYPVSYLEIEDEMLKKIEANKYDLYLLLKPDIPAIQDGTREFLNERQSHFESIKKELKSRKLPFVVISGSFDDRLKTSMKIIKDLYEEKKKLTV